MRGITLIGMPGSGKSTVGRLLAERIGFAFVDLDNLIRDSEGKTHAQIAAEKGDAELVRLENEYTAALNLEKTVFAPGGSMVYSSVAMEKLCKETMVVFLSLPLEMISKNLGADIKSRGIVGFNEKGLDGVLAERRPLYEKYAGHTIDCAGLAPQEICEKLVALLG